MDLDLEPDVTVAAGWWLFFALSDGGRGERVELERGESARARLAAEARVEVEARIAAGGEDSIRLILALLESSSDDRGPPIVGSGPLGLGQRPR
ncbi:MAG: hypothetical protein ABI873_05490 [Marmoricola sp.]